MKGEDKDKATLKMSEFRLRSNNLTWVKLDPAVAKERINDLYKQVKSINLPSFF